MIYYSHNLGLLAWTPPRNCDRNPDGTYPAPLYSRSMEWEEVLP